MTASPAGRVTGPNKRQKGRSPVLALCGPTSVGKTGVALELAQELRGRGERPVAVNCDSIQIYRGLETLSGAATAEEQRQLEHRLLGFMATSEEMSAGTYAEIAHVEIDRLLAEGCLPLVVGGTGLWLRAALCRLDLKPPVEPVVRNEVDREMEEKGAEALHGELPQRFSSAVHPNDRNRIARWTALLRSGIEPELDSSGMWHADLRYPTRMIGLIDSREAIARRIDERVDAMSRKASEEAHAVLGSNPSRTAAAAIGLDEFVTGDLERIKAQHRAYAKRQITWMKKMPEIELIERRGRSDADLARLIMEVW